MYEPFLFSDPYLDGHVHTVFVHILGSYIRIGAIVPDDIHDDVLGFKVTGPDGQHCDIFLLFDA